MEGGTDVLSGGDGGPGTDCTCSVILVPLKIARTWVLPVILLPIYFNISPK